MRTAEERVQAQKEEQHVAENLHYNSDLQNLLQQKPYTLERQGNKNRDEAHAGVS